MWSNSDCPVMQNIVILCWLMIGTTAAASSEVQPITSARLGVEANIWFTAGMASAGSPLVSTLLQVKVCPSAASGPLNGATSAMVSGPLELFAGLPEPDVPLLPQAVRAAARAAAARTAMPRSRRVRDAGPERCDERVAEPGTERLAERRTGRVIAFMEPSEMLSLTRLPERRERTSPATATAR